MTRWSPARHGLRPRVDRSAGRPPTAPPPAPASRWFVAAAPRGPL